MDCQRVSVEVLRGGYIYETIDEKGDRRRAIFPDIGDVADLLARDLKFDHITTCDLLKIARSSPNGGTLHWTFVRDGGAMKRMRVILDDVPKPVLP